MVETIIKINTEKYYIDSNKYVYIRSIIKKNHEIWAIPLTAYT